MKALLLVDLQKDFVQGGALAVKGGEEIIELANSLMPHFDLRVATQDFHPENHGSFASEPGLIGTLSELGGLPQVLWPVHCVQGSTGAEFVDGLNMKAIDKIIPKGTDPKIDSYSGFFDNGRRKQTNLYSYLKEQKVTEIYVLGLATDYCVKYTALDAVDLGFKTFLIEDACRGVELNSGDIEKALVEMKQKGVDIIQSKQLKELSNDTL